MNTSKRMSPAHTRMAVAKKWDNHHANWLIGVPTAPSWPQTFSLHSLTEKDVVGDLSGTREWVSSWKQLKLIGGTVEWTSRRWPSGDQDLPSRLTLATPEEMAQFLGVDQTWVRATERYAVWCAQFPRLASSRPVARLCDEVLIGYDDADFFRLSSLLQWLIENPQSGLYLRQLPVASVDTKWIWPRRGVVQKLVCQLFEGAESTGFHSLCGLLAEPARLRMRILCPRLRASVGGLCDIEAPIAQLAALQLEPTISIVVENLNTGIALPDIDGAVVFMGLGLAVDQLEAINWLHMARRHLYWGDLDTHGFAILARARKRFPLMRSILMDEHTLLAHRELWVSEPAPCRIESPEGLNQSESIVYVGLKSNLWGNQIRMEQERIAWPVALSTVFEALR